MICTKDNWDVFEPLFDTMRELVNADFNPIDFTICAWRCDFRTAVEHLKPLL